MNSQSGAFSRYRLFLGFVIALCLSALIGVGCGGGSSVSSVNILNTLSGRVLVEQNLASVRSAVTLVGVAGAEVWIEDLADDARFHGITGEGGAYEFHGVPEGAHRVVARYTDASGFLKNRSFWATVPIGAETTVVDVLTLEPARNHVTGVLRDTNGNFLPVGTVLTLWGEAFTVGLNGTFVSPPLPDAVSEEIILVKTGGAGQVAVISAPFVSSVVPAFLDLRIDTTGTALNHPPSGTLIARDATGITSLMSPGGQLSLMVNGFDADPDETDRLTYHWSTSLGTLESGSTPAEKTFRAPSWTGIATITVVITDPNGATGSVKLPLLIGITSPSQADLAPPTVTLAALASETFDNNPFQVKVTFSEVVTGFEAGDLTVTNGTVSDLATVTAGTVYTATIAPTAIGDVRIELAEGAAADNGGNVNRAATPVTLPNRSSSGDDTTPPADPTLNAVTTPTNASPQLLSGTKSTDTSTVLVNGSNAGVTYPTATSWQYSMALVEGANAISVKSRDAAGNESGAVTSSIVYDSIAPAVPTINAVTTPTNVTPQVLSGTRPADAATVLVNGSTAGVTFPSATTWEYSMSLTSGENLFSVTCRDTVGNESGAVTTSVWFADMPPSAPTNVTLTPVGGTIVANTLNSTNTNLTVAATIVAGQASGGEAELLFNGAPFVPPVKDTSIVNSETIVTFDFGLAGNAAVQAKIPTGGGFSVRLRDAFGNTSVSTVGNPTLVVDYAVPVAPVISATAIPANLGGTGNTADHINAALKADFGNFKVSIANTGVGNEAGTLYIRLSDSNGTPNTWTTAGGAIAAGAAAADVGTFVAGAIDSFVDGNLEIEAWITDAAGNGSAHSVVVKTYGLDAFVPAAVLSDDHADSSVCDADTVVITATFTEADQIDETTVPAITIGALVNGAAMTKTDNLHWTYSWNVPAGNDGDHAVSVTAKDRAGNACSPATGKTSYTVDNTPPSNPTDVTLTPVGGTVVANTLNTTNTNLTASATIVAGVAAGGEAELLFDGNPFNPAVKDTAIAAGDTTVTFSLGLAGNAALQAKIPAGGEFSVRLRDVCENTSVSLVNPTLAVDYVAPAAPVISATAIAANLGGTANTADHINAALKAAFSDFKVSIANTGGGNEAGTLFVTLSDSTGAPHTYTTAGDAIAAGAGAAESGTFAAGAIDAFIDGNLGIEAWITDAAGNPSFHASVEKTYALDTASPTVVLSDNHPDAIVRDADTVLITATFTEADQIDETAVPALTIGALVADVAMTKIDNLHWTYSWNVPAGNDGVHAVSIAARDRAGNSSTAATGKTSYTIDNTTPTAPSAVTLTPVGGTIVANTLNSTNTNLMASATITAGDATGGEAELLIGGNSFDPAMKDANIAAGDTVVTFNFGLLSEAAVQAKFAAGGVMSVRIRDVAGNTNVSTVDNPTLAVDYSVPAAPVISATAISANLGGTANAADHINAALKAAFNNFKVSLANTGGGNETGTLFIKLSDSNATPHVYTTAGDVIAAGAAAIDTGTFAAGAINAFIDGNLGIECWIRDAAGNESTHASVVKIYGLDIVAPSVVLSDDHPDALVCDADTVTFTATFTEADQINETTGPAITIGAFVTAAPMVKTDNLHWTYAWNVPAGNEGTHAVSITAKDRAGNSSSAATGKTSYVIDNTAPSVTKLGDGSGDLNIPKNTSANLVFSEALTVNSQTAVTTALTAGSNLTPIYSWSGATLTITSPNTGTGITFAADVATNVRDIAGNISSGLLLVDSSILPTVTTLGDGLSDFTIAQDAVVTLTFSAGLNNANQTIVENALTAGANGEPGYSWNPAKNILSLTGAVGGTSFPSDVTANVTAGVNISNGLLLIDSAP